MNVMVVHSTAVKDSTLNALAKDLPVIISEVMEVPGGKIAILKPEQVCLAFSRASSRDTGADIRIMAFSRSNDPRISTGNARAQEILAKVKEAIARSGEACSIDVRLYFMEIGAAANSPDSTSV